MGTEGTMVVRYVEPVRTAAERSLRSLVRRQGVLLLILGTLRRPRMRGGRRRRDHRSCVSVVVPGLQDGDVRVIRDVDEAVGFVDAP
jgi:hypothetical protein